MNTIIDPFYLYLILQLDSINSSLGFLGFASAVASLGCFIVCAMHKSDDCYSWNSDYLEQRGEERTVLLKWGKRASLAFFLCLTTTTLLPTSERMAILVVLPAMANNEAVQGEAKELYDLAKRGLTKLVEDPSTTTDEE